MTNMVAPVFRSLFPPIIFNSPSGIKYAVSGDVWIPIDETITLDALRLVWVPQISKDIKPVARIQSWTAKSSDGKRNYKVTYNGRNWNCECVGFGYRGKCKHVTNIQSTLIKNK